MTDNQDKEFLTDRKTSYLNNRQKTAYQPSGYAEKVRQNGCPHAESMQELLHTLCQTGLQADILKVRGGRSAYEFR
jgi:hypothetical protein